MLEYAIAWENVNDVVSKRKRLPLSYKVSNSQCRYFLIQYVIYSVIVLLVPEAQKQAVETSIAVEESLLYLDQIGFGLLMALTNLRNGACRNMRQLMHIHTKLCRCTVEFLTGQV